MTKREDVEYHARALGLHEEYSSELGNAMECIQHQMHYRRPFVYGLQYCVAEHACAYKNHSNVMGTPQQMYPECLYGRIETLVDTLLRSKGDTL